MLKPRSYSGNELIDFTLEIDPIPAQISEGLDFFGNNLTRFSIHEMHQMLRVRSHSLISRGVLQYELGEGRKMPSPITVAQTREELKKINPDYILARQYIIESQLINNYPQSILEYSSKFFGPETPLFEASLELTSGIYNDFEFVPGFTTITTPLNEVMDGKKGVCQDFAHIAIACLRAQGLAARYVSGYIETIAPPGQPKLTGVDASHAWFAVFIPGMGWVDFDPTNNQLPGENYVTMAWGRDYYDVPPLKGVIYTNGANSLKVSVHMEQVKS